MRCLAALVTTLLAFPAAADTALWQGQSIALRVEERGIICQAGALSITVEGESLRAILSGNRGELTGALKADGTLEMSGRKGTHIYSFTGKRDGDSMRGSWIDAGSGCGGTWSAKSPAKP